MFVKITAKRQVTFPARGVDFNPASGDADFLVEFGPEVDPELKASWT